MASDIWLRTILIVRKKIRCRHIGYSFRLTARVILYAPSHRQDSTYHGLCYTSRGALAGTNTGMVATGQGKVMKIQRQGKVREFCAGSGKFEILRKVREIQENPLKVGKI